MAGEQEPKPFVVDPKTKEEIEKEGWEDNARIKFRKREEEEGMTDEAKLKREELEQMENFADLGTAIRAKKKINLTADEILKELESFQASPAVGKIFHGLKAGEFKGFCYERLDHGTEKVIDFIDKDGNLSEATLAPLKISELQNFGASFEKSMEKLGFKEQPYSEVSKIFYQLLNEKLRRIQKQAKESVSREFDF